MKAGLHAVERAEREVEYRRTQLRDASGQLCHQVQTNVRQAGYVLGGLAALALTARVINRRRATDQNASQATIHASSDTESRPSWKAVVGGPLLALVTRHVVDMATKHVMAEWAEAQSRVRNQQPAHNHRGRQPSNG